MISFLSILLDAGVILCMGVGLYQLACELRGLHLSIEKMREETRMLVEAADTRERRLLGEAREFEPPIKPAPLPEARVVKRWA